MELRRHTVVTTPFAYRNPDDPVVLVIVSDPGVRQRVQSILDGMSSTCLLAAADAPAARRAIRVLDRPLDLLIVDTDLDRGIDGVRLAADLTAVDPSLPVLLLARPASGGPRPPSPWPVLWKPFASLALVSCVRSLLAGRRTSLASVA
jgi:hypothetical protein